MVCGLLVALTVTAAFAGRSAWFDVPTPTEELVPSFSTIALGATAWSDSCNEKIIAGWNEGIGEVSEELAAADFQGVEFHPEALAWKTIDDAARRTLRHEPKSLEEAVQLGRALNADMVAWGTASSSKTGTEIDGNATYSGEILWNLVDARTGKLVAERRVSPWIPFGWRAMDGPCLRLGKDLVPGLFPALAEVEYTLVKDKQHRDLYELLTDGDLAQLHARLKDMERVTPTDPAVQFDLAVVEEIRGDLEGAEVRYGRAQGVDPDMIEEAKERLARRREARRRLAALGYPVSVAEVSAIPEVDLAPERDAVTATRLLVTSEPPGARVFIGAAEYGTTPVEIRGLDPGPAMLTLVLPDHGLGTTTSQLVPGRVVATHIPLVRDQGGVRILARPDSRVEVGGASHVVGPAGVVEVSGLPVGEHRVLITLEDHTPIEYQLKVESGRVTEAHTDQRLEPADLSVHVAPATAKITIDGWPVGSAASIERHIAGGQAFAEVVLPPGRHQIQATAPDHEPSSREIELMPGESLQVTFALALSTCDFTLQLRPVGSRVTFDGVPYEAGAELVLPGLTVGVHRVEVTHQDYIPWAGEVLVATAGGRSAQVGLQPMPGRLLVVSQPLEAEVWIGGQKVGVTPFSGEVPAGEATIVVKKLGFVEGEREMDILPNRDHRLTIVLDAR